MIGGRQPEMSGLRQLPNNEQTLFTSLLKGNYTCISLLLKKNQSCVFFMVYFSLSSSDLTLCLGAIVNHNWDCLSETVVCTIRKTLQHKIILKGSFFFFWCNLWVTVLILTNHTHWKKCTYGDILAVASCTFCNIFKEKCPVRGTEEL